MRRPRLIAGLAGPPARSTPAIRQNARNQPLIDRSRCGKICQNPVDFQSLVRARVTYAGFRPPPKGGGSINPTTAASSVQKLMVSAAAAGGTC